MGYLSAIETKICAIAVLLSTAFWQTFGLIHPSLSQAIAVWAPIFVYSWPFRAVIWQFHVLFISLPVNIVAFGLMG